MDTFNAIETIEAFSIILSDCNTPASNLNNFKEEVPTL